MTIAINSHSLESYGAKFVLGAHALRQLPTDTGREFAIAGRSNSGKSSAINALLGRHNLARTSKTPGRTQQINIFELAPNLRLVDLPGYGYAKISARLKQHWASELPRYFKQRQALTAVILTVDIRRGISDLDHAMLELLRPRGFELLVLLTKADKLSRNKINRAQTELLTDLQNNGLMNICVRPFSIHQQSCINLARRVIEAWI